MGDQQVTVPRKLWENPDPESSRMYEFMQAVNRKYGEKVKTYEDLHTYSVTKRSQFWAQLFDFSNYVHSGSYTTVVDETQPVDAIPRWFNGVFINFAENILYSRAPGGLTDLRSTHSKEGAKIAVTEVREGASETRHVSWASLRRDAAKMAAAMKARGVKKGDRVVCVGSNSVDTLLVWLGAAWLGAIFSSSSTDMGVNGILQRTIQVDPKLVFMDDSTFYNGRVTDLRQKMAEVVEGLQECGSFSGCVSIPRFSEAKDISQIRKTETLATFLGSGAASPPDFVRVAFHERFLICYSSGTTGMPKAIVHSIGGVLINGFKEGVLHEDLGPDSVVLQYTTTGWIMYVANVCILLVGGRSVMYDGSPFQPDASILVRLTGEHGVTKLGISPRWLFEVAKNGPSPREMTDLSKLRHVTTTGMVLSDQLFEWFYDKGFPSHVHLFNIAGGTDISGCFGIGNKLEPVYVGGCQGVGLGIDVRVYDSLLPDGAGKEVPDGDPGELVAVSSFPNVPVLFWGDKTPAATPGSRYHGAYFARFDHVWAHGDFCIFHPVTKNFAVLGRADGVLNPSGVRFGSAEIYGVIEHYFTDRVQDSLCVGQKRPQDSDESVVLFLLMKPGHKFDRKLANEVKEAISRDLSKRHVPKYVFETPDIPTTVNLKKVELPVKQIVSGKTITPSGTLLNPHSLDYYYQFAKVEELIGPKEKL